MVDLSSKIFLKHLFLWIDARKDLVHSGAPGRSFGLGYSDKLYLEYNFICTQHNMTLINKRMEKNIQEY